MISRIALSALPLAAAAALTLGGVAHAAPADVAHARPAAVPTVDDNGTIGYQAVQDSNDTTYFTHITSYFGLGNPQYGRRNPVLIPNPAVDAFLGAHPTIGHWMSFNHNPGITVDAARIGLCGGTEYTRGTTNAGTTVQELIVPVAQFSFDVVAFEGQFAFSPQGDTCLDSTLPSGEAAVVLSNVPDTDTVALDVLYDGLHSHNGVPPGYATFVATDLTRPSVSQVNTMGAVFHTPHSEFYEADAGLVGADGRPQRSLAGDVLPDSRGPNLAVKLAHVQLNGNDAATGHEVHGTLQSDAAWTAVPVVYHANGDYAGAVSVFFSDHFSVFTAPGTLTGH
jgi:hypothetical protein